MTAALQKSGWQGQEAPEEEVICEGLTSCD